jgi:hypothetical protein
MTNDQTLNRSKVLYVHEGMFALNLAFATMAMIFLYSHTLTAQLFRMDASINIFLHLPQTDLVLGYWALFLPGTALAICIWLLLSWSSHSPVTHELLRSVGGVAAFTALPIYWLFARYESSRRYGLSLLNSIQLYEVIFVLLLLGLYLYLGRNWSVPVWASAGLILLHFGFWFWQFGTLYVFSANATPIAFLPIIGFLSAVVWFLYNRARSSIYGLPANIGRGDFAVRNP